MSESAPILAVDVEDGIATMTLNRPEAGNAINMPLADALAEATGRCADDPAIRCVIVTGAGKLFCGGGDIAAFAAAGDESSALIRALAATIHVSVHRLMTMAKPVVTLVNGPAAGAGMSLALAGDVVIAAQSAHFTAAYGGVGLTPDGGMSWHLPRLIGMRRAQEVLLANRRIGADEALALGMITAVTAPDQLAAEGLAKAQQLARGPVTAMGAAKTLLLESYTATLAVQLDRETDSIAAAAGRAEYREGVSAFLAKRKPDFPSAT